MNSNAGFNAELEKAMQLGYVALPESYRIVTYPELSGGSPTGVATAALFSVMMSKDV